MDKLKRNRKNNNHLFKKQEKFKPKKSLKNPRNKLSQR
jgi:hypothetical protein